MERGFIFAASSGNKEVVEMTKMSNKAVLWTLKEHFLAMYKITFKLKET